MLIELIRVLEFIATCSIVVTIVWMVIKLYRRHNRLAAEKRQQLKEQQYRQTYGPHGSSATMKGTREKRIEEEWRI